MPHINIKCFSAPNEGKQKELAKELTEVITRIFGCDEKVVSIAVEPIEKTIWHEEVYVPEIINKKNLLCKNPEY